VSHAAPSPGLCGTCRHARVTRNRRGSAFYLCRRSETDARFRKYPPLPMLECFGYERRTVGDRGGVGSADSREPEP
jgi:hypothetical protein